MPDDEPPDSRKKYTVHVNGKPDYVENQGKRMTAPQLFHQIMLYERGENPNLSQEQYELYKQELEDLENQRLERGPIAKPISIRTLHKKQ